MANRTRFAGFYNAIDYNYGGPSSGLPEGLSVLSAPSVTGAGTLVLAFGQTTLTDGTVIFPLSTNAPISVGSGGQAETVTPSAVSNPTLGSYGAPSVTATFNNLHGQGDLISSGTFGLQEAINAAAAAGGGTVIIDAAWAANGGTNAIVATAMATLPATVSIEDNRSGNTGLLKTAQVTLTNAQILAMFTTPIVVVPAQGAGTLIDVIDVVLENVNTGVAYAAGAAIQLSYGAGVTTAASVTVLATFLTSPTAPQIIKAAGALASSLATASLNVAVNITCATQNFTTGTGTLKVRCNYVVLSGL